MAGTKLVMECKNQDEGKYTEVYAPIFRRDGSVTNAEAKYDENDFRSLVDDSKNRTYSDISGAIVDMIVSSGTKTFPPKTVEVCGCNQNYYVVLIDGVYWSVYKTACKFLLHTD